MQETRRARPGSTAISKQDSRDQREILDLHELVSADEYADANAETDAMPSLSMTEDGLRVAPIRERYEQDMAEQAAAEAAAKEPDAEEESGDTSVWKDLKRTLGL